MHRLTGERRWSAQNRGGNRTVGGGGIPGFGAGAGGGSGLGLGRRGRLSRVARSGLLRKPHSLKRETLTVGALHRALIDGRRNRRQREGSELQPFVMLQVRPSALDA